MADVPGVCDVPLTRAVVQYRESQDRSGVPAGVRDLGLAVVVDGRSPVRSRVVDLGSGRVRTLDLSRELVVLDWVYPPTLEHLRQLVDGVTDASPADGTRLEGYCGAITRAVIERAGFGPITRSTLLRLAFRDLALDLDPHEAAAVRVLLGPGRVARLHLDADHARLVVRTAGEHRDGPLEEALAEAFPTFELRRTPPRLPEGSMGYLVLLPVPATLPDMRSAMDRVRRGSGRLVARFEPDRYRGIENHLATFGARDSLAAFLLGDGRGGSEPLGRGAPASEAIH